MGLEGHRYGRNTRIGLPHFSANTAPTPAGWRLETETTSVEILPLLRT
jgi:hypothetical protein